MKYLKTERLFLREFTEDDVTNLFLLDSDPEVMKWLTNGIPTRKSVVEKRVAETIKVMEKYKHLFGMWAVIEKSSNNFLGWFHLRPGKNDPENLKKVELGYRLFRNLWGQGYATEGSLALIDKAFKDLSVEEVFATTMQKNMASRKVLEKSGLVFSHEFYDDRFPIKSEKAVYYSIKRS